MIFFLHLYQYLPFVCRVFLLKFSTNVYLYVKYIYVKGHIVSSRGQVVTAKRMKITKTVKKATKINKKNFTEILLIIKSIGSISVKFHSNNDLYAFRRLI